MAEDTADVATEITPEQFDADEQDSAKAEPSTAKEAESKSEAKDKAETKPEPAKAEAKSDDSKEPDDTASDQPDDTKADTEDESEEQSEDEAEETPKPTKADERKSQLNTEIRDLVAQRNALREEVTKANEVYQPASEQDLVDEGMSATDAKVEALRQQIELKDYNERVAEAQLTMESESQRVLNDFPVFDPRSDSYDKELAEEASELFEANLITDPNTNQIIGTNVSPYQLYKTLAKASSNSATKGQIKGQQATEKMLANADASTSVAPAKKKVDPLTALWEEDL